MYENRFRKSTERREEKKRLMRMDEGGEMYKNKWIKMDAKTMNEKSDDKQKGWRTIMETNN